MSLSGSSQTDTVSTAIDTSNVNSTAAGSAYQTERYGANYTYTFGGFDAGVTYTVTLGFAETYFPAAGDRVFSVSANGTAELTNFDIFATAGGENRAVNETFTVTADANGNIALNFVSSVDQASLRNVEIF